MYSSLLLPWSPHPSASETLYRAANLVRTKGTIFLLPPPKSVLRETFNAPPRANTRMSAGAVALCKHFERGGALTSSSVEVETAEAGKKLEERGGKEEDENGDRQERKLEEEEREENGDEHETATATQQDNPNQENNIMKRNPQREIQKHKQKPPHPFWTLPTGPNTYKTSIASAHLDSMLRDGRWRNVMMLHEGVGVYEVRNSRGYGMRWTLELDLDLDSEGKRKGGWEGRQRDDDAWENRSDDLTINDCDSVERETVGDAKETTADDGYRIKRTTFRGFLEPIAGLDHELPICD